jgi:hypothetical protein
VVCAASKDAHEFAVQIAEAHHEKKVERESGDHGDFDGGLQGGGGVEVSMAALLCIK